MKKSIYTLGMRTLDHISDVGKGVQIVLSAFIYLPYCIKAHKEVLRQLILCGQNSFGVTSTVALFTGMILALPAASVIKFIVPKIYNYWGGVRIQEEK